MKVVETFMKRVKNYIRAVWETLKFAFMSAYTGKSYDQTIEEFYSPKYDYIDDLLN